MVRFLATALLTAAIGLFAATAQADMLVGYWSFDDETATDLSGMANHGTVNGGATFSTDVATILGSGKAIQFDGVDDYVEIAHSASLALNDVMTISLWINGDPTTMAYGRPLAKNSGATGGFEIQRNNLTAAAQIRLDTSAEDNQLRTIGNLFDDTWHHMALVVDKGTLDIYFDGVKTSTTYDHGNGFDDGAALVLGRTSGGARPFTGLLDDVAIWNVALPEDSILALADGTETPLTAEIPEPSTAFLAILGLLALTGYGWRCRRS